LAARWKKNRADRLTRLAQAIELLSDHDRNLIRESSRVERLRVRGAVELHGLCHSFIAALNEKLSLPSVELDPFEYSAAHYTDGVPALFQINLRGRLLQLEFEATEELSSREDFRKPYVLFGAVRSFNQELLDHNTIGEKAIFYCPETDGKNGEDAGHWHYFDSRTYRTGLVTQDFLVTELHHLL